MIVVVTYSSISMNVIIFSLTFCAICFMPLRVHCVITVAVYIEIVICKRWDLDCPLKI